jgi:hypothetical protein
MAHYALIEDGVVTNVIVAEQDFIDTQSGTWVQTSYNTRAGVHILQGTPLRKNYAGVGMIYDTDRDAFYEDTCLWEAPIAYPSDASEEKLYTWDESTLSWIEVTE